VTDPAARVVVAVAFAFAFVGSEVSVGAAPGADSAAFDCGDGPLGPPAARVADARDDRPNA